MPENVPSGTPVQTHAATDDPFARPSQLAAFQTSAAHAGADATPHTYPGAGHFYTDPSLPDHDPTATGHTWQHIDTLLHRARQRTSH